MALVSYQDTASPEVFKITMIDDRPELQLMRAYRFGSLDGFAGSVRFG